MARTSKTLDMWMRVNRLPGGDWLFSRTLCFKAPYFATIRPRVKKLAHGYCEVQMPKRRAINNHIGSVHAIAMCNMAELAGGLMTDATVTPAYRWIPKGMTVAYKHKATTDLVAVGRPAKPDEPLSDGMEYPVSVSITDPQGREVMTAEITMWISAVE